MIKLDLDQLTARFIDQWSSAIPVSFDNQPDDDYPDGHVHFSVVIGASKHTYGSASAGGKLQQGRVWLTIELPDQQGDGDAIELMEQFSTIFRNWTNGPIQCRTEDLKAPFTSKNGLVIWQISIPFESIRPYSG